MQKVRSQPLFCFKLCACKQKGPVGPKIQEMSSAKADESADTIIYINVCYSDKFVHGNPTR